ncbi:MAG TPA: TolC family protein [Verrucomicrobia bacterium]|nr:TolC family protein [Verrucomicrobiales bacterium]HIL55864.1 TolC family protein [Verrucomicrobiota bacterium]
MQSLKNKITQHSLLFLMVLFGLLQIQNGKAETEQENAGDVGLSELIALGLKNNPRLISLRGAITIAEAQKKVARDWPDPQIRFRKNWGSNGIPAPFTETRTESYTQQVSRTEINEDGQEKKSISEETVNRNISKTITEGSNKTVTEETIEEHSEENITILPNPEIFEPGGTKTDTRDMIRNGTETDFHDTNPFADEEDTQLQFRLYVPHPGIRKARLARAEQGVKLARAVALNQERDVVIKIREEYEQLQYLKAQIELLELEQAAAKSYSEIQSKMLSSGLITIDKIEYVGNEDLSVEGAQIEFNSQRDNLAARVGLKNSQRIRITDKLISPSIDLDHTHLEYLIRMSLANRGELTTIRAKEKIAQTSLNESRAKKIPWFDYVQAGIGREEEGGQRTGESWGIQLAMSVPLFSWLGHESEVREAAVASYYSQKGATQTIITAEVVASYENLKRAKKYRDRAQKHAIAQKEYNTQFIERIKNTERHKLEKIRFEIAQNATKTTQQRLVAERTYNKALLQLEKALGASLEKVFTAPVDDHVTESALPSKGIMIKNETSNKRLSKKDASPKRADSRLQTKRKFPIVDKVRSGLRSLTPKIFRKKK